MNTLEICTDASLKEFNNGRIFTCSGAISISTADQLSIVTPDSTNNKGELIAVYLGVKLANKIIHENPSMYDSIALYSDSQFSIYGLRNWMSQWIKTTDSNGIIYGSNKSPVKNQDLFKMIITYCYINRLVINFYNQKGHVNVNSTGELAKANEAFKNQNGFMLKPEEIFKISFYNDLVDKTSRSLLEEVNPNDYKPNISSRDGINMCRYVIPKDFKKYIK